jgi:[protein-PII] uridylyltransferase
VTKVQHVLERGTMGEELAASLTERIEAVRGLLAQEPDADVDRFVLRMPRGYFLSVAPADAARHFHTIAPHLGSEELRTAATSGSRPSTYQLLVVTPDRPGLLSSVAGSLAVGGISILSAQVFTTSDHVAVDLFEVEGAFEPEITEERWRGVRSTLRRVIEGATSIDRKVADMRRYYPGPTVQTPVTVRVDNDASDFSTVLEVGAPDRMGLLYDITQALSALGVDVHLAKVATFDGRVVDAFYVRDELGRKLTDADELADVESALRRRLG